MRNQIQSMADAVRAAKVYEFIRNEYPPDPEGRPSMEREVADSAFDAALNRDFATMLDVAQQLGASRSSILVHRIVEAGFWPH